MGSIYRPYSYEPISVGHRLGAGNTVTFESGSGANRNKLTGNFIYNNDVGGKEGPRSSRRRGRALLAAAASRPEEASPAGLAPSSCPYLPYVL